MKITDTRVQMLLTAANTLAALHLYIADAT